MSAYTDAVSRGLQGMEAVSSGACPGCTVCAENHGIKLLDDDGNDRPAGAVDAEFRAMWVSGLTHDEGSFSWRPCGVCGCKLGGDRHAWHWIDPNDPTHAVMHESDMCADCVLYLANGDEPEAWRER